MEKDRTIEEELQYWKDQSAFHCKESIRIWREGNKRAQGMVNALECVVRRHIEVGCTDKFGIPVGIYTVCKNALAEWNDGK